MCLWQDAEKCSERSVRGFDGAEPRSLSATLWKEWVCACLLVAVRVNAETAEGGPLVTWKSLLVTYTSALPTASS